MRQEVRVLLQLTLDVSTELTKEEINNKVTSAIHFEKEDSIDVMMIDIIETREEAEIYGDENNES